MATQYTSVLKLALPTQGELSGSWGNVVNDNITTMIEQAIAGLAVINTWSTNSHTLTSANGTTSESRCAMLSLTDSGSNLSGAASVICPALAKTYIVKNASGQAATLKTPSGSGIAIPNGKTMLLFCDGTNVLEAVNHVVTMSAGTLTITGLTTFASLKGADATTVTGILDEDNMASNSATKLVTQQSVKAYVDSQVGTVDTLAEILANGNTTGGADIVASTDDKVQFRDAAIYINSSADGQLDIVADTEIQIAATTIDINGAINASGEIIAASLDISGDIDVDGTTNLDVVDIDGAVDMATTLAVAGNVDFNGDLDVDGTTNLDVVDIDGAVDMATTLAVAGNVDFNGDLDVDGTTNLDVVDIDGAVDMATTLAVAGNVDFNGDLDVDGTTNLDAVDIDGATQIDATLSVGVDDTGYDVKFFGATSGKSLLWDESADSLIVTGTIDATTVEFDNLSGTGAVNVTNILDEDNLASDSATALATQQSIKSYVDAQVGSFDTLAEVLANGNTTGGTDVELSTTDKVQFRDSAIYINSSADGQLDIVADTEIQIAATTIDINGAINASGEIIAASLDISGNIDVDGVTNLDVVDIDGAVDMASTLTVAGVLTGASLDISGDIDIDGTANLDVVDIDGAVDMATTLAVAGNVDFNGDLDVDGVTNLDVVDIDGAVDMASTLTVAGVLTGASLDISGDIDVDGTTNLDVVDIDGAVDMASTLTVAGVLTGTSLDISGDIDIDGTSNLDVVDIDGAVDMASTLTVAGDLNVDSGLLFADVSANRVGINQASPDVSLDIGANTDAVHLPVGTTAQRPGSPAAGYFRYNSSLSAFEGYTDAWGSIGGGGTNTFTHDVFTCNGSTTAFALSQSTESENNLMVFIDGAFQDQGAYSIATASGTTTLTMSVAPANTRKLVVYTVAAAVSGSNLNIDSMTGDGSDTTLTLSIAPVNENNTQVFIDGVYQNKSTYSISGTTLTFSTAPPNTSAVEVMTMTQTDINVPVDGTITSAKLSGALTTPAALTATGVLTANAGVVVDNFTLDGTTLALSSGDLTLDVAGDIILDADGGDITIKDGGTTYGSIGVANEDLHIGSNGDQSGLRFQATSIMPRKNGADANGTVDLGLASNQFKDFYLSGGVVFGPASASNVSSQTLSSYEEGNWTPVVKSGTTVIAITNNFAKYTKIGNTVYVTAYVTRGDAASLSGDIGIYGLPFTVLSGSVQINGGCWFDTTTTDEVAMNYFVGGGVYIQPKEVGASNDYVTADTFQNTRPLYLSGSYIV